MYQNLPQLQYDLLDGAGVKVGIVDGGIDASHPALHQRVVDGVSFVASPAGEEVGHGTAVAYIIHQKAPQAHLYDLRILDANLTSSVDNMVQAIYWAIDNQLDVLNLSLGTTQLQFHSQINKACEQAKKANLILVSAAHHSGEPSFPAILPSVLGVIGGRIYGRYTYYIRQDNPIQCIARGDQQRVAGHHHHYYFVSGTSYAAPHITGLVALIRQAIPQASFAHVLELLTTHAAPTQDINAHILDVHFRQDIWQEAQQTQSNQYNKQPEITPLQYQIQEIVAQTLKLTTTEADALWQKPLIDPIFKLNAQNSITIIEELQKSFGFPICDDTLRIETFYSIKSLSDAVEHWSSNGNSNPTQPTYHHPKT